MLLKKLGRELLYCFPDHLKVANDCILKHVRLVEGRSALFRTRFDALDPLVEIGRGNVRFALLSLKTESERHLSTGKVFKEDRCLGKLISHRLVAGDEWHVQLLCKGDVLRVVCWVAGFVGKA